jgi:hypothetical protein
VVYYQNLGTDNELEFYMEKRFDEMSAGQAQRLSGESRTIQFSEAMRRSARRGDGPRVSEFSPYQAGGCSFSR